MSEHRWVLGSIGVKYNSEVREPTDYFLPFACTKCGARLRLRRPKSMIIFDQPLPEEIKNNRIEIDCEMMLIRHIMES